MGGQRHGPAVLPPGKETRYLFYNRLGRPQGRQERVRKISPHWDSIPGASRNIDYASLANIINFTTTVQNCIVLYGERGKH